MFVLTFQNVVSQEYDKCSLIYCEYNLHWHTQCTLHTLSLKMLRVSFHNIFLNVYMYVCNTIKCYLLLVCIYVGHLFSAESSCLSSPEDPSFCTVRRYPVFSSCSKYIQCDASCNSVVVTCPKDGAGQQLYYSDTAQTCLIRDNVDCTGKSITSVLTICDVCLHVLIWAR